MIILVMVLLLQVQEHTLLKDHDVALSLAMEFKDCCCGDPYKPFMHRSNGYSVEEQIWSKLRPSSVDLEDAMDQWLLVAPKAEERKVMKLKKLIERTHARSYYSPSYGTAIVCEVPGYFVGIATDTAATVFEPRRLRPIPLTSNGMWICPSCGQACAEWQAHTLPDYYTCPSCGRQFYGYERLR